MGGHDVLRARILTSLCRNAEREISYLRMLPEKASQGDLEEATKATSLIVQDEVSGRARIEVIRGRDVSGEISRLANENDLLILGLQRFSRRRKAFGHVTLRIVRGTRCPVLMVSRRG